MRFAAFEKSLALTVVGLIAGISMVTGTLAYADSPARFAPAESGVYIELNDISQLRKDWQNDPLSDFIRKNIPLPQAGSGWGEAKKLLGMTDAELIDTYFGKSVAMVFRSQGDEEPGMVISKVADADFEHLRQKLGLSAVNSIKQFKVFQTPDKAAHVITGEGWVMAFNKKYAAGISQVIAGTHGSLADDGTFNKWVAKLPAERFGTAYIRDRGGNGTSSGDVHVAGLVKQKRNLTLQYFGHSAEYAPIFAMIRDGKTNEFGPLPASTLAAVSFNVRQDTNADANKFLDRLASPKSFQKQIAPHISSPLVAFLGEVKGEDIDPSPGMDIPAPGLAIKISKHSVADDATRIIDGLLLFANIAMAKWEVDPISIDELKYKGATFKTANIGIPLAQRTQRPELKPLVLTYGRVGDWYIICSQDHFYRKCVDAELDPKTSLANSAYFKSLGLKAHESPIASAFVKPEHLARHMQTWLDHWRRVRPDVFSNLNDPQTAEAQLIRGAQIVTGLLSQFKSMSVQVHKSGDDLAARVDVVRD